MLITICAPYMRSLNGKGSLYEIRTISTTMCKYRSKQLKTQPFYKIKNVSEVMESKVTKLKEYITLKTPGLSKIKFKYTSF